MSLNCGSEWPVPTFTNSCANHLQCKQTSFKPSIRHAELSQVGMDM